MSKPLKQVMIDGRRWFLGERGLALLVMIIGACFIATGVHRFRVRPEHFGVLSILGCVVGAFGGFFLLLITDYLFHHARLVFIPWFASLIYFACIQPHLAVGLGIALWFMMATQLRG